MKIKIDGLDRKFSLLMRHKAGWACERCGKQYEPPTSALHTSHFYGRRKKSVRFDPQNISVLCFGCHQYMGENPKEHVDWFRERLGELHFDMLTLKANNHEKPDYELIRIWLNRELKNAGL